MTPVVLDLSPALLSLEFRSVLKNMDCVRFVLLHFNILDQGSRFGRGLQSTISRTHIEKQMSIQSCQSSRAGQKRAVTFVALFDLLFGKTLGIGVLLLAKPKSATKSL
jgi:hypothetical protein